MLRASDQILRVEEIHLQHIPALHGKTLGEAALGRCMGLLVVAVKAGDGKYHFNPGAQAVLKPDDILIVIGTREQLAAVTNLEAG
jgi:K+/H+ antiporter YhaU regulatory subunit KhtT